MTKPSLDPPHGDLAKVDLARLEAAILQSVIERSDKTVEPASIARAVSGSHVEEWGPLMQPLRRVAVRLAKEGRIAIYRKGKAVDQDNFKGTYKLGPVRHD